MGTPDFSVPALTALVEAGHDVIAVVTQPDKPKGRGGKMQYTPVKEKAMFYGIPVYQPKRVRNPECVEELRKYHADVIVVIAFGQILPKSILELTPYGCINVHASLLPKYRGAAPIQWAVINGEKETGITTMYMAKGLDTGDMIDKIVIPVEPKETGETLHDKLSAAGGKLILETLAKLEAGTAVRIPQNDAESSYAGMLTKELGEIDWTKSAAAIERLIRGLNSWPSAYTHMNGKTLKIWDADVEADPANGQTAVPGTVTDVKKDCFYVQTGDGQLKGNEVQLQGKKRMPVRAFLLGYPVKKGMVYGGQN